MFGKHSIILAIATCAVTALPSTYVSRDNDYASCHYVLTPHVPVDPATTNLVAEFNYIFGRALAIADSPNLINNPGMTFTEAPDGDFFASNQMRAGGWTCAQTKAFMESLAGSDQLGPSGVTWLIESSKCTCGY